MSGNVWELVWDWYQAAYENDTPTDPRRAVHIHGTGEPGRRHH